MAVTVSVEDAVLRLKAEIIAQDWRLSRRRAEQLEAALGTLQAHLHDRKAVHAMLVMAANVLSYVKGHGASPPETIDFLKEAMAHVVNLHEELTVDPKRDEETFKGLYLRFDRLKGRIQRQADGPPALPADQPPPAAAIESAVPPADPSPAAASDVRRLLDTCRADLAKAGASGLGRLFDDWLASPAVVALLGEAVPEPPRASEAQPAPAPLATDQGGGQNWPSTPSGKRLQGAPDARRRPASYTEVCEQASDKADGVPCDRLAPVSACPPTPVLVLRLDGRSLAVAGSAIALVRPITPAMAARYLQNASVPLKDFSRFLGKFSSQFSGTLALCQDRVLRDLCLPLMIPQGYDLPESPSPDSRALLVISNGNWHGALACEEVLDRDQVMVRFLRQQNGDLSGLAYLEGGESLPLLDPLLMLRREGFLLMH